MLKTTSTVVTWIGDKFSQIGEWWDAPLEEGTMTNGELVTASFDEHRFAWTLVITGVAITAAVLLGGKIVQSGIVAGILITLALFMVLTYDTGKRAQRLRRMLWLSRHAMAVDVTLALICTFAFMGAGTTLGIGLAMVSILTSLGLKALRYSRKRFERMVEEAEKEE